MSVSPIGARRATNPASVEALGLNLRERAAVRNEHTADYHWNEHDGTWYVACACGWGINSEHASAVHDWHHEHVGGWMLAASREKRANEAVQRALDAGDALTRERFAMAEADGAVVSIAPTAQPWFYSRPGAPAHLLVGTEETACGVLMRSAAMARARAYTKRCATCARIAGE